MKVTFRSSATVNEDGQIVVMTEAVDLPRGVEITIPPYVLTRAQSARVAGAVVGTQGMVCAWCRKAPPEASEQGSEG
jgi:hypothetical protein